MSGEKNEKLSYLMMAKEAIQTEKSRNGTSKQVRGQQFFLDFIVTFVLL